MDLSAYISKKTFSSFRKSFTRSIIRLSIIATALSLSVMIISQSIFNGFQKEIAQKVFGFWGHIHITDIQSNRSLEPITIKLNKGFLDTLQSVIPPGMESAPVRHVQQFLIYPTIAGSNSDFEGLFLKGLGQDFDWKFFKEFLKKGHILTLNDTSWVRQILLSEETAQRLGVDTGQSLILNFIVDNEHLKRKVKVVGVYNTGLGEYDRRFGLVDIKLLQQIMKKHEGEVTGLELFCKELNQTELVNEYIYNNMLPLDWYSETIRSKFPNIFEWLALQDTNKHFILFLILSVCLINMATTLMILILERTHMIGILTVLGMQRWDQRKIFLRYAARILLWSILIGNLIGFGLCVIQKKFQIIRLSESDYYLSYVPVDLNLGPVLFLNVLFFVVIIISMTIPSLIIQSIKPVKALKFR